MKENKKNDQLGKDAKVDLKQNTMNKGPKNTDSDSSKKTSTANDLKQTDKKKIK